MLRASVIVLRTSKRVRMVRRDEWKQYREKNGSHVAPFAHHFKDFPF